MQSFSKSLFQGYSPSLEAQFRHSFANSCIARRKELMSLVVTMIGVGFNVTGDTRAMLVLMTK